MKSQQSGFTLVEVTLALLVIAIGMLSLFQLFPAGLRENMLSRADLHQSMFAEYVLSGVEARAAPTQASRSWPRRARLMR